MALSSAVAQESVSKVSSYAFSKLHDVASRENMVTTMKMAVSKLGNAIERSGKMPITDVSLLWQKKEIKSVYIKGKKFLRQLEGREEVGQVMTSSSFLGRLITRAAKMPIFSLLGFDKGYLSSSDVKEFEKYAEWADKFLERVESGYSHRCDMISNNPLVRLLFEWKTLVCRRKKGTFLQGVFTIWATHHDRGVEASLLYMHADPKVPEKSFLLKLGLRLSESTNIFGTAIKCLQPLVSQFKVPAEFAIGELSQLQAATTGNLLELSPSRVDALVPLKKHFADMSHDSRLDPICCNEHGPSPSSDNTVSSSELAHIFPEEVTFIHFSFHELLENKYNLRGSSDEASRKKVPLKVQVIFMPHFYHGGVFLQRVGLEGPTSIEFGSNHKYRLISIQEVLDTVGSTAKQSYLHRPKLTRYGIHWFSKHGAAFFDVKKPTTRRSAKRKR